MAVAAGTRPAGGGTGGPFPLAGDLSGNTTASVVTGIDGNPVTQSLNTIYVDPNGDASSSGTNPGTPTTLANAIATAGPSTNVVIGEGVYADALVIPANSITLTARQGGTQSESVTIQGLVTIGAGIARFRAFGIRFDGGFDDDSDGEHYLAACSAGGGTYDHANPTSFVIWKDCDFAAMTYISTGAGAGSSLTIEGATATLGSFTAGASGTSIEIREATTQRLTLTAGSIEIRDATIIDATLGIDASAGTTVRLRGSQVTTSGGTPTPITVAGNYTITDTVYAPSGSTLGTEIGVPRSFTPGIRRTLMSMRPAARRATDQTFTVAPGAYPYAGSVIYMSYGSALDPIILPPGTYRTKVELFLSVTAINTEYWFDVFLNGAPSEDAPGENFRPSTAPVGSATGSIPVGSDSTFTLVSTIPVWLDLRIAKLAGAGNVIARRASIETFLEVAHT